VTPVDFRRDLLRQKTRVPGLSCGVVCVILRLAVLVEHRLVTDTDRQTDRQTDTGLRLVPRMHSIRGKKVNKKVQWRSTRYKQAENIIYMRRNQESNQGRITPRSPHGAD